MKDVKVISKTIPANPRSDNYQIGSTVMRAGGGGIVSVDLSGKLDKSVWTANFEELTDPDGNEYLYLSKPIVMAAGATMYAGKDILIPSIFEGLPLDQTSIGWRDGKLSVLGSIGGGISSAPVTGAGNAITSAFLSDDGKVLSLVKGATFLTEHQSLADYAKKTDIPSLAGYATESWVNNKGYLIATSQDKSNWNTAFGWGDHAGAGYAKTSDLANYVTLATEQEITGAKTFTADTTAFKGITIGGVSVKKSEDGVLILDGNLLVTGGVTMHALGSRTAATIMDGVSVDGTTIVKENGKLVVVGGGGGLDTARMWAELGSAGSEQIAISHLTTALGGCVKKTGDNMTGELSFGSTNRRVKIGVGYVTQQILETNSGWAQSYAFTKLDNTTFAEFGVLGENQSFTYAYVGSAYNTPWQTWNASGTNINVPLTVSGNTVWHAGNLPKNGLWGGSNWVNHSNINASYTAQSFIESHLVSLYAGVSARGAWDYSGNGYIATDFGNIHLAGTAYTAWGANYNRSLLFITPGSSSGVSSPLLNEMLFYTSNSDDGSYPKGWTRVLTNRNYNSYVPTFTGAGANGTWGISISGSAADLGGYAAAEYMRKWNTIITVGSWSRLCVANNRDLAGSFIITVQYTRGNVVVNNTFLISFGHSAHGQIITLGTHGYTQIQARVTSYASSANDISFEILDTYANSGSTQTASCTATKINCVLLPNDAYVAGSGEVRASTTTSFNRLKVNDATVAFTSDNVASATRLETARSIWGQPFDGTSNVSGHLYLENGYIYRNVNGTPKTVLDFHGDGSLALNYGLDGVGLPCTIYGKVRCISSSSDGQQVHKIVTYPSAPYGLITNILNSGTVTLQSQREHNNSECFSLILNPNGGNVGIGNNNPVYKLDVAGDIKSYGWLRTISTQGWYNETYGGGIYMEDATWVRTYNGKQFYCDSGSESAIHTAGGVHAAGRVYAGGYIKAENGYSVRYDAGSWLSMATRGNCIVADQQNSPASAHSLFRTQWNNGCVMSYGGLGDMMGFFAYSAYNIANGINSRSFATYWNSDGTLVHEGNLLLSGGATMNGSDITKKDIINHILLPLDKIANAPLIRYRWKDNRNTCTNIGGSAQYTNSLLPECAYKVGDTWSMDYATTAYAFAVSTAVHFADYIKKQATKEDARDIEIKELKQRIEILERRTA